MATCSICSDFRLEELERRKIMVQRMSSLFASAKGGCRTCSILKECFDGLSDTPQYMTSFMWHNDDVNGKKVAPFLKLEEDEQRKIDIYRVAGDPCPWEIFRKKINLPRSTASDESYSWASQQLKQCLQVGTHPKCGTESQAPLPTRVVDVGHDGTNVKVVETTKDQSSKYVTLSHRWGDPALMTTKLTAHTRNDYMTGLSIDLLPQTFKDAVLFTRRMGIQYLWIDSLCIIQPDKERDSEEDKHVSREDWTRESANMCLVYQNSHVTLAAASANSCRDGLFFSPKLVKIAGSGSPKYCLYARKEITHDSSDFPLLSRGWVFQETMLSPRTIFFGQHELLYQCRSDISCQCRGSMSSPIPDFLKLPALNHAQNNPGPMDLVNQWHQLATSYSKTSVSYQTDKLAAIEGLAQYTRQLRRLGDDQYLAGLWKDSLAFDLLWTVNTPPWTPFYGERAENKDDSTAKTPWSSDEWLFPTWSWVSNSSRVAWVSPIYFKPESSHIRLLDKSINSTDVSPIYPRYNLDLRGTLVSSNLNIIEAPLKGKTFYPDYVFRSSSRRPVSPDATVYCLRVYLDEYEYWSLVLLKVDEAKEIYERIGVVSFKDLDYGDLHLRAFIKKGSAGLEDLALSYVSEALVPWWEPHKGWIPKEIDITIM